MAVFEGTRYKERPTSITEIARLIKEEINNSLEGVTVGVTSKKTSLSRSIRITINKMPYSELIINSRANTGRIRYSEEYLELQKRIEEIANQWNRRETISEADYHDASYYVGVHVSPDAVIGRQTKLKEYDYALLKDKEELDEDYRHIGNYNIGFLDWKGRAIDIRTRGVENGVNGSITIDSKPFWTGTIEGKKFGQELIVTLFNIIEGR